MLQRDLTTTEVAEMLGFSVHAVIKWCKTGMLPHYFIGTSKHRRIRLKDVLAFAREHEVPVKELSRRKV